jgi:hypothetical protein
MAKPKVKLDHAGIAAILKSAPVAQLVNSAAASIAAATDARGRAVTVETYVSDRAAASVAIEAADGMGVQAKYGSLTRAATSTGLEVRSKRG